MIGEVYRFSRLRTMRPRIDVGATVVAIGLLVSLSPSGRNITTSVEDAEQLNSICMRLVEDDITRDDEATDGFSQVPTGLSQLWLIGIELAASTNCVEETQGRFSVLALSGDVAGDFGQVLPSKCGAKDSGHYRGLPCSSRSFSSSCLSTSRSNAAASPR